MSGEVLDCLNRERDIRIKPKLSGGKTAFRCTPALMRESGSELPRTMIKFINSVMQMSFLNVIELFKCSVTATLFGRKRPLRFDNSTDSIFYKIN